MKSESLRIQVSEGGQTRVELSFAAESAGNLIRLVPPHLRQKLVEHAIDLEAISASAQARDFAPGELFLFTDGARQVRGWLE